MLDDRKLQITTSLHGNVRAIHDVDYTHKACNDDNLYSC